jgi:hypothetical protein
MHQIPRRDRDESNDEMKSENMPPLIGILLRLAEQREAAISAMVQALDRDDLESAKIASLTLHGGSEPKNCEPMVG